LLDAVADVMVVPSRMGNLPQTAFNTTGLPDAVEHRRTGYLASAFDHAEYLVAGVR
jgi:hypothetical protein